MLRATAVAALLCTALCEEQKVMITMRDGFNLSTWINCDLDKGSTKKTILFETSTYTHHGTEEIVVAMKEALGPDYCAVRQDMRGSGDSKGQDFSLWRTSGNDSYDSFRWLAGQPWANGDVYQTGVSSDGLGSFFSVMDKPQWLKKQFVMWASVLPHNFVFPGGAFRDALTNGWLAAIFPRQFPALRHEARANEFPGEWWNPVNMTGKCADLVDFPAVLLAGWYDIFLQGNLAAYDCYNEGPSKTYMVVGPCGHCQIWGCPVYDSASSQSELAAAMALDTFAGGKVPELIRGITLFVLGSADSSGGMDKSGPGNYWSTVERFPSFTERKYYLRSGGVLSEQQATEEAPLSYVYDPSRPVETRGGNNLMIKCGAMDQRVVEQNRTDVLVFASSPLGEDLVMTGPLRAWLEVESNATDTDFTAKLTHLYPDGRALLINDGIARMRWRDGTTGGVAPKPMVPGTVYGVEISMWNTSYIIPKGHRVRLSVSSSNAPRFQPNPNNGLPLTEDFEGKQLLAQNTVHIKSSYLSLPIVSKSDLPPFDMEAALEAYYTERGPAFKAAVKKVAQIARDKAAGIAGVEK
eukprot:TRINITY_DN1795_c0_g4_i2.p1 TRINITY_DN1795_c0_g4~~TRINITY_DN1795_c0_g4_i2.p1  ORF type:complete len:593 (+),score=172.55 TRINITY_DN1795_c0_g4_i2:45-1781(+)